jgi:site-specific DNA-methyltransferase (adenine-specific)
VILSGDNLPHLRALPSESVDAICTDPPYGLGRIPKPAEVLAYLRGSDLKTGDFMGKAWDLPPLSVWLECYRVLKPGRLLLSFSGTRTFDLIALGLRLAGFLPVDTIQAACLAWSHGQGFPKGKAQLKPAWEPILVMRKPGPLRPLGIDACRVGSGGDKGNWPITGRASTRGSMSGPMDAAPTDQSSGRYPTNLTLIHLPWCQPAGVRRVKGTAPPGKPTRGKAHGGYEGWGHATNSTHPGFSPDGTEEIAAWLCAPGCPARELDQQAGPRKSGKMRAGVQRSNRNSYSGAMPERTAGATYGDEGAVSRFFPTFSWSEDDLFPLYYTGKASRTERNKGCGRLPVSDEDSNLMTSGWKADARHPDGGYPTTTTKPRSNHHTTIKPIELIRWLVRLSSLPGETVLDPYLGSGTTACAAEQEGRQWIGMERELDYIAICEARIAHWRKRQLGLFSRPVVAAAMASLLAGEGIEDD